MRRVRGHEMAKATVENALLDLIAKRRSVPLHELLGAPRKKVLSGISIGIQDSPDALVAAVRAHVRLVDDGAGDAVGLESGAPGVDVV